MEFITCVLLVISTLFVLRGFETAPANIPYGQNVNIDSDAFGSGAGSLSEGYLTASTAVSKDEASNFNKLGSKNLELPNDTSDLKFNNDSVSTRSKRYSQGMYDVPRCGVSDYASQGMLYKWNKASLTYYIANFPAYISSADVEQLLQRAFNEWSRVTNLDFSRVYEPQADFNIVFGSSEHLNRYSYCHIHFDGSTLAHAFYPQSGEIHFNTDFYFNRHSQDQFFHTAVHEIGHALGLDHSTSRASIMYPTLGNILSELPQRDIESIQMIYGKRPPPLHVQYGFLWPGK